MLCGPGRIAALPRCPFTVGPGDRRGRGLRLRPAALIVGFGLAGMLAETVAADTLRYAILRVGPVDPNMRAEPVAMNDSGTIVGYYQNVGFLWQGGQLTPLGPDGSGTRAEAINNRGQIAGWMAGSVGNLAFVWDEGTFTFLPALGADLPARAYDINEEGEVVGVARKPGQSFEVAVYWDAQGRLTPIGTLGDDCCSWAYGISDNGVVVGTSGDSPFVERGTPLLWDARVGGLPGPLPNPGNLIGEALGINASGTACGQLDDDAVLWIEGSSEPEILPPLSAFDNAIAVAVNGLEDVVGLSDLQRPVLWTAGEVYSLQDLIPDGSNWALLEVADINNIGWIVGIGEQAGITDRQGFVLVPITYQLNLESPPLGGRRAMFTIQGATPGLMQYLAYSTDGVGRTPIPQLNVVLGIEDPRLAIAGPANNDGSVRLQVLVPRDAVGRRAWFQAAEWRRVTNTLDVRFR